MDAERKIQALMHENFTKKNEDVISKLQTKVQDYERPYTAEDIDAMGV